MPSKKKLFFAIGGGCLLLLICIVVGFVVLGYLLTDKDFDQKTDEYKAKGREFGKSTDQAGCMKEGFSRSKAAGLLNINGTAYNANFVNGCLATSRPTPNFCQGVPSLFDLSYLDWEKRECERNGLDTVKTGCLLVLDEKINVCHPSFGK